MKRKWDFAVALQVPSGAIIKRPVHDVPAIRDAHERTHDHAAEVWQDGRLVGVID